MGLMDILGGGTGGNNSLVSAAINMISQHPGGLGGILSQLNSAGLTTQVQSWIGNGTNLPVSADQITAALGSGKLGELAQQAGLTRAQAAQALSQHLPDIVDKSTPDGTLPAGGFEAEALSFLKSKFFS